MKANPLACALLVLLAVAVQLPAQQPVTNAAGSNQSNWEPVSSSGTNWTRSQAIAAWLSKVTSTTITRNTRTNGDTGIAVAFRTNIVSQADFAAIKTKAESGDPVAQYQLGMLYGWDVAGQTNRHADIIWIRKAEEQGLPEAQFNLGTVYQNGNGVAQDNAEALRWFRKAADQGYTVAEYTIGRFYHFGDMGLSKDYGEEFKWFSKAAQQGLVYAQYGVGLCYNGDGVEVRARRAYSDDEIQALLKVAGKRRIVYLTAVLTGIRLGELKALRWGDMGLGAEKPSVTVRASVSKNHKLACLPLHLDLVAELLHYRPVDAKAADLVFEGLMPRSRAFKADLEAAGIPKTDSQGRVVDFHSLRHTFCTNLHRAGVPQREAMELMRHNDPRLTANTYADASLFSLRAAVAKLSFPATKNDAQGDAQSSVPGGLLPSLPVTVGEGSKNEKTPVDKGDNSLPDLLCHIESKTGEWWALQDSNL